MLAIRLALCIANLQHVFPCGAAAASAASAWACRLRAERQLKEDAQRQKVDAEAEEHEVEEALRHTRQQLATVSRELLDH